MCAARVVAYPQSGYALRAAASKASIGVRLNRAAAWKVWSALEARLERGELISLDGAMGTELTDRGAVDADAHWAGFPSQLCESSAEAVRAVHSEYVSAGCNVLTANTYATNRHVMALKGFDQASGRMGTAVEDANVRAVALAREATALRPRGEVLVAGSISNHMPSSAGARGWPSPETELNNYREQARALVRSGVDVIFLEMIKDTAHGDRAVRAATEAGVPVVIGLALDVEGGGGRRDGGDDDDIGEVVLRDEPATNVEAVIAEWGAHENVVGFSTMHCAPEDVEPMVSVMRSAYSGFIGAYPVQGVDPDSATLSPEAFVGWARMWYAAGANAVGGSSGFAPQHIVGLASFVAQYNRVLIDGPRITRPVRREYVYTPAKLPRSAGPTGDVDDEGSLLRAAGPTGDLILRDGS